MRKNTSFLYSSLVRNVRIKNQRQTKNDPTTNVQSDKYILYEHD